MNKTKWAPSAPRLSSGLLSLSLALLIISHYKESMAIFVQKAKCVLGLTEVKEREAIDTPRQSTDIIE